MILKLKSSKFQEITGANKIPKPRDPSKIKMKDDTPPHLIEIKETAHRYINANRFSNVVSKEEEITVKDFGRLVGLLAKDALEDFIKDNEEEWNNLKPEDKKIITKSLSRASSGVVTKNIDEYINKN